MTALALHRDPAPVPDDPKIVGISAGWIDTPNPDSQFADLLGRQGRQLGQRRCVKRRGDQENRVGPGGSTLVNLCRIMATWCW